MEANAVARFDQGERYESFVALIAEKRIDSVCPTCKQRHEFPDLAHSIDYSMPCVVEVGYVEHPNQKELPLA